MPILTDDSFVPVQNDKRFPETDARRIPSDSHKNPAHGRRLQIQCHKFDKGSYSGTGFAVEGAAREPRYHLLARLKTLSYGRFLGLYTCDDEKHG